MNVLVTGSSGFVGSAVVDRLVAIDGVVVRAATRGPLTVSPAVDVAISPDLSDIADWRNALRGIDVVVHLAGRVHVMRDAVTDSPAEFRRVNVDGTLRLARQAAEADVRRFVFVSSVKVNGELTSPGRPFTEADRPAPRDPYGVSKAEAEAKLGELAAASRMEVVTVRPTLVYGPGAKGNFRTLVRLLSRGIPLPLGAIRDNRRSFIGLDNLVDLICVCLVHPAAVGETFLAADGEDVATADLLRRMSGALGVPSRLVPIPTAALHAVLALIGKRQIFQRLCGDLQVDISKARRLLSWNPPVGLDEGLRRAFKDVSGR